MQEKKEKKTIEVMLARQEDNFVYNSASKCVKTDLYFT